MDEQELLKLFGEAKAIITDSHIVYKAGDHGTAYVNKDALYKYVRTISLLCKDIADHFCGYNIQVVAGPTIGGVILSQRVPDWLKPHEHQAPPIAVFAEEEMEGDRKIRVFKRGYASEIPGKRVLVVEDVLTTGASAKLVVEAVKKLGGQVVGVGALCNRGGIKPEDLGVDELFCLVNVKMDKYPADDCPLCKEGVPINLEVGHGKDFVAKYGQPVKKA